MKRRMLALLLVIVMLIGMVPTSVFADAASPESSVSAVEAENSAGSRGRNGSPHGGRDGGSYRGTHGTL